MAPLKITTTGHATKTHPAERALLRLAIKDTGPKPATVASNVQNATAKLQNILSTLTPKSATSCATPVLKWTMGTPTSYTYMRSESLSKASRYHAVSTTLEIEFVEFKALASLAAQLSGLDFVHLVGVEWSLTDATKEVVSREARTLACRDALTRAQDYAREFGKENGSVEAVEVFESSGSGSAKDGGDGFRVMDVCNEGRHSYSSSGDLGLSLQPVDIEFRVDLTVKFVAE
ncbi:hypothetical protein BJX68DRAFT_223366 [Aspergillus pseudodeflectus]|uniref:DUF541 domain-containing protein n=1 Tax=Aspergillus pseudodeflectus TaxID=176178 RepID=A0ABR4LBC4_9EURO